MSTLITSIRKYSTDIISNMFTSKQNMFIGRWSLPNNKKSINIIIDRNNEDHCGCCFVDKSISIKQKEIEVDDEYLLPYIMIS